MAITAYKTFIAGEVLFASDVNNSLSRIIDNGGGDLSSPRKADLAITSSYKVTLDTDADSSISAASDDIAVIELQGKDLFIFDGDAGSVQNGLTFTGSAEGTNVSIAATGDSTNIGLSIATKGTGVPTLYNGSLELLTFTADASAVNHVNIENEATGAATSGPIISAAGDDTNVGLKLKGKGTGPVMLGDGELQWPDSDGLAGQALVTDGAAGLSFATTGNKNLIINGCARVWRRGATITSATAFPNSDDNYVADHVLLLSDGDDRYDVSQETSVVPTGAYAAFKLECETVGSPSEKAGLLFPIEARDAARIIGGTASLSFQARTTSGQIENLRAVVLSWDEGGARSPDAITSDVVSAWNGEGSDPTWATGWTAENTPSNLALSNSYQTFSVENVSIDTSDAVNVAVFIWIDDTDVVADDVVYVADVQLEEGAYATAFERRPFVVELVRCERFFRTSFPLGTTPAQSATTDGALRYIAYANGAVDGGIHLVFAPPMFAAPSVTFYNPGAANALWRNVEDVVDSGAGTSFGATTTGIHLVGAGHAVNDEQGDTIGVHVTLEAEM